MNEKEGIEKSKEDLLQDSYLLESLLNHIPDMIYFKDKECRFVRVSEAKAEEVGAEPEDLIGKTDADFFSEEQAEERLEDEKRVMEEEEPIVNKIEESTINGQKRWLSTTKIPRYDDEGNVIGTLGISRDVTQRKKAEENLTFERNLLRSLLDQIPDSIYFKDEDNRFLRVSKTKAEHMGVEPEEVVGKTDFDFYPEEQAEEMAEDDNRVMEEEEPIVGKIEKVTRPGGDNRWVSVTKAPRYDDEGNVIGTLGISRDITPRKESGKSLNFERNLLRSLLNHTPDQIYFKDRKHRFMLLNEPVAERLGTTVEEAIGKTDFDFFPKELAREYYEDEEAVMRSGEPTINKLEKTRVKGETRWNHTTKVPLFNKKGEAAGIGGISRDYTKRKRLEEKFSSERKLFQSLLAQIPDSIYFKDEENRFLRVSKTKAEHMGVEPEEVVGKTDFDFYPEEQAREMAADDRKVMEEEEPVTNKIEKVTRPSGEERWVSVTKVPRYDGEGNVIGTLGISRDLTELWVLLKRREALSKKKL